MTLVGGAILLFAFFSIIFYTFINGISPMPTSAKVQKKLLDSLPSKMEGEIYDLGSGWGTLVLGLARKYPNCTVIGFETSLVPYLVSKFLLMGRKNADILRHDFLQVYLGDASLITAYLYPKVMPQLQLQLDDELSPEALVVTHTFRFPGWEPVRTLHAPDMYKTPIYVYREI
ncbi:MAG: methyltransferase [Simkaniaceae bacterium]|nr:methyltransferase [Simkaniaceae bacterium]